MPGLHASATVPGLIFMFLVDTSFTMLARYLRITCRFLSYCFSASFSEIVLLSASDSGFCLLSLAFFLDFIFLYRKFRDEAGVNLEFILHIVVFSRIVVPKVMPAFVAL